MSVPQRDLRHDGNGLVSTERGQKGLKLVWSDGSHGFFHYVWLRHCCFCEICGDCYSSKRYLLPSDIPLDIEPAEVSILESGDLHMVWANDGHLSTYDAGWLRDHRYEAEPRQNRRHRPSLWGADIQTRVPSVDFTEASRSDTARMGLYRHLRDYGFCTVTGGPTEPGSISALADLAGGMDIGAYGQIFDLSPTSSVRTMGNTTRPVPPHTDEPFRLMPPGILVLHCIRAADDGGDTILVDGFNLAETIRAENPDHFDLLSSVDHYFVRRHAGSLDQRVHAPVFALDDHGHLAGVRIHTRSSGPLDVSADRMHDYFAAYHHLSELMMRPENQLRLRMKPGEGVLLDNHRVLHSRSDFTDTRRFLQLCNVARGDFHEHYRLLANRLGLDDEAGLILPAGAIV